MQVRSQGKSGNSEISEPEKVMAKPVEIREFQNEGFTDTLLVRTKSVRIHHYYTTHLYAEMQNFIKLDRLKLQDEIS